MNRNILARSAIIDHETGEFYIDGVYFPWHLTECGPVVEKNGEVPLLEVTLTLFVEGTVEVRTPEGRRVYDPVLGDIGECARRKVRADLRAAYPDLEIPL